MDPGADAKTLECRFMRRPLFLVGTQRNVGKTTMAVGLANAFHRRGLKVGYTKPLGQRAKDQKGHVIHDDAVVVGRSLGLRDTEQVEMAVALPTGRVEQEMQDLHSEELLEKVREQFIAATRGCDVVVVEGMGHVAMGSCLQLSAAEVCRAVNARALLVSGGGIGRAIDDISLCGTFMTARGADLMGVIVNQVWPEKFQKVKDATTKGLSILGIRSFGTVPFETQLTTPTMHQVQELVQGEVVSGLDQMEVRVRNTIVAAMEPSHMVRYLQPGALLITPGDRSDNILAAFSAHVLSSHGEPLLAGMILTGGFRPDGTVMKLIHDSGLPVILSREDTYTIASKYRGATFKIEPDDTGKIGTAISLVAEYVDVDGILAAMEA